MTKDLSPQLEPHELLRLSRERAGITQWQAAARLGVSQTVLCEIELGRRPVPPGMAEQAQEAYTLAAELGSAVECQSAKATRAAPLGDRQINR